MEIKEITIEGFKSIGEIHIFKPNPFTVLVGPNASGKSNLFEALEFVALCHIMSPTEVTKFFGNENDILNQVIKSDAPLIKFEIDLGKFKPLIEIRPKGNSKAQQISSTLWNSIGTYAPKLIGKGVKEAKVLFEYAKDPNYIQFVNFTRLFVGKEAEEVKRPVQDDTRLAFNAKNLEKVLKRILRDKNNKEEIIEILHLLIPGFEDIEIKTEELSSSDNLLVFEKSLKNPLPKRLISNGTYNIIAIIAALFQSEERQFLCIEEPENGLNPKVVRELVNIIREKCKENGHYIWLNTHSQTLVSELKPEEIILVDKVKGLTQVKQVKGMDLHGMRMDEALFTNSLGGGIPW